MDICTPQGSGQHRVAWVITECEKSLVRRRPAWKDFLGKSILAWSPSSRLDFTSQGANWISFYISVFWAKMLSVQCTEFPNIGLGFRFWNLRSRFGNKQSSPGSHRLGSCVVKQGFQLQSVCFPWSPVRTLKGLVRIMPRIHKKSAACMTGFLCSKGTEFFLKYFLA